MPVSTECAAALLSFRYPSNNNNNVILAACFTDTERSDDTHIDSVTVVLFLVGRICPLMQERFLRPLLKGKAF